MPRLSAQSGGQGLVNGFPGWIGSAAPNTNGQVEAGKFRNVTIGDRQFGQGTVEVGVSVGVAVAPDSISSDPDCEASPTATS